MSKGLRLVEHKDGDNAERPVLGAHDFEGITYQTNVSLKVLATFQRNPLTRYIL